MIKRTEAKRMIFETKGKIFGVKFTKKNGEERTMQCRRGVSKGVKGEGLKYNPEKFNLIPVFDMSNDGFRMINADTISEVKIGGTRYTVK
jgi:hypothetical protein